MRSKRTRRMQSAGVAIVTLVCVAAGVLVFAGRAPALAAAGTDAVIQGTVSSGDGGLQGIQVKAKLNGSNMTTTVYTDERGRYEFPPLAAGKYRVSVGKTWRADVDLTAPGVTKDFRVELGPGFMNQTTGASWTRIMEGSDAEKKGFMTTCGNCHSTFTLFNKPRFTAADWASIGRTMVNVDKVQASLVDKEYEVSTKQARFKALNEFLERGITKELVEDHVADAIVRPTGKLSRAVFTEWDLTGIVIQSGVWAPWVAPDGIIWFDYEGIDGISGVGRLDPKTGAVKTWPSGIKQGFFHDIFGDAQGNLWIAGSNANKIVKFDTKTEKFTIWDTPTATKSRWPHTCAFDADGFLWCTLEMGAGAIMKLDPRTGKIDEYAVKAKEKDPYGITVDHEGTVWFTVKQASQVVKMDRHTGQMTEYSFPTPNAGPRRIKEDSKGRLWISQYYTDQIAMLDPKTMKFTEYKVGQIGGPYFIVVDKNDKVWFNMLSGGVVGFFDPETKVFDQVPFPQAGTHVRDVSFDYSTDPFGIVYCVVFEGSSSSARSGTAPTIGRVSIRK